jgi:hypothetical protein
LRWRFALSDSAAALGINIIMQQYLISKARNTVTGETVKTQDLRLELNQRSMAQELAQQLADKMTARTRVAWVGFCEVYTPTVRK